MEILNKVISTLNLIEVSGKDNMNHLLGCIIALEKLVDEMDSIQKSQAQMDQIPEADAEIAD